MPVTIDDKGQQSLLNSQLENFQMIPSHQNIENQQAKFVFNIETEQNPQPLQLLFQLPTVQTSNQLQQQIDVSDSQKKYHQQNQVTQTLNTMSDSQHCVQHLNQSSLMSQQCSISPQALRENEPELQTQRQSSQHQVGTQTIGSADNAFEIQSFSSKQTNIEQQNKGMKISMKKGDKRLKEKRYLTRSNPNNKSGFSSEANTLSLTQMSATQIVNSNKTIDVDSETDSNHDTALTLACAGGHEELVELLLARGANIEHRDKKGFTPLILAATAGHTKVVEILIREKADLEAQSERTKDTPLSLACSGGRYEVVEILLKSGANKEHRNVSDYTPLSLAASGGYVSIIKLLLNQGAEINSRTGSKLGISPLMLAAMNGHTPAVRLLLDMGSDINAQIETNRNTALTLACFQGRHEVVSLLLDRKANVEHRAKTGLTPLMEAASGGYIEVGRVLLDKGADVNAAPVPSSRDTALTIAADKGHLKFVELLLARNAAVEVKNKKGNSPLWLAANGGHLSVIEVLYNAGADIDSQDNRKVSCLMAAFRKGHVKVIKWMVNHVSQFPSDQEMTRFVSTISDKDILDKCNECVKVIRAAKETQAKKAYINASILLRELDMEKNREEQRKAAAAKRRERKKRRKQEKREMQKKTDINPNQKPQNQALERMYTKEDSEENETDDSDDEQEENENIVTELPKRVPATQSDIRQEKEEGDSGIDANSQGSCSSSEAKLHLNKNKTDLKTHVRKKTKDQQRPKSFIQSTTTAITSTNQATNIVNQHLKNKNKDIDIAPKAVTCTKPEIGNIVGKEIQPKNSPKPLIKTRNDHLQTDTISKVVQEDPIKIINKTPTMAANVAVVVVDKDEKEQPAKKRQNLRSYQSDTHSPNKTISSFSSKREEGWKEVIRKNSVQQSSTIELKKVQVPTTAISRVIGRGGSNINTIRSVTGAHIEVEKQGKIQGDRSITIKGSVEATKQAYYLITTLIRDSDADIFQILAREKITKSPIANNASQLSIGTWEKQKTVYVSAASGEAENLPSKKTSTPIGFVAKPAPATKITSSQRFIDQKNSQTNPIGSNPIAMVEKKINSTNTGVLASNKITLPNRLNACADKNQENFISPAFSSSGITPKFKDGEKNLEDVTKPQQQQEIRLPLNVSSSNVTQFSNIQMLDDIKKIHHVSNHIQFENNNKGNSSNPINHSAGLPTFLDNSFMLNENSMNSDFSDKNLECLTQQLNFSNKSGLKCPLQANANMKNNMHSNPQNQVYSLFNDSFGNQWDPKQYQDNIASNTFLDHDTVVKVDISKAPGYRGNMVSSPISSKTSSHSTTPPSNMTVASKSIDARLTSPIQQLSKHTTLRNMPITEEHNLNIIHNNNLLHQGSIVPPNQFKMIQQPDIYGVNPSQATESGLNRDLNCPTYDPYSHGQNIYSEGEHQVQQLRNFQPFNSRLNPKAASFSYLASSQQNSTYQVDSNPSVGGYTPTIYTNNAYKVLPNPVLLNQNPISANTTSNLGLQWYQEPSGLNRDPMNTDNQMILRSGLSPPTISSNNPLPGCSDDRKMPRPIGMERNWKIANHFANFQPYHTNVVGSTDNEIGNNNSNWPVDMKKSYDEQTPWAEVSYNQRGYFEEMNPGVEQYQVTFKFLPCYL